MKWKSSNETELGTTRYKSVFAFLPTTVVSNSDERKELGWL